MAASNGGWSGTGAANASDLVPMMVLVPERQRAAMLGGGQFQAPTATTPNRLDTLYDEALARFDAFCFWYARPPRSAMGMRAMAERLEAYGSPDALRLAGDLRHALANAGI